MRVTVRCPAKINAFLAVGPKDHSGYHPLRTTFQAVGLYDDLICSHANTMRITCDWNAFPVENTVSKAIRLLREFGDVPTLDIHLVKRIPVQAGLGGGSSDGAGFLRAINRFVDVPFDSKTLTEVAAAVGADVPFFLIGGRAKAEGYGEKLTPLDDAPTQWVALAKPPVNCSTAEAFGKLDELTFEWKEFSADSQFHNDFERVMPCACGDLIELLQFRGASSTGLCGSGSAVFGMFESEERARIAHQELERMAGIESWCVPTLSRADSLRVEIES